MDEVILKSAHEWCDVSGIEILDPDGWRGKNGRPMTDLIDRDEFNRRMVVSTVSLRAAREWLEECDATF